MYGIEYPELIIILAVGAILYFLPSIIAHKRRGRNAGGITLLNILLGWTLLVWVVCFIWAYIDRERPTECPFCTGEIASHQKICPHCKEVLIAPTEYKKCKGCGAGIPIQATKCRYCGTWVKKDTDQG